MTRPLSIGAKTTRLDTVELPPRPEMLKAPPRPIGKSLAPSGGLPIPSTRPRLIARVFGPVRRLIRMEPPPPTLEGFMAQHKDSLVKLPAEQRKQVEKLVNYFINENAGSSRQASKRLNTVGELLEDGKLTKKDASRQSVLDLVVAKLDDGLASWAKSAQIKGKLRSDPGKVRELMLGNILKTVASPDRVYQGSGTSDCTTAVLEGFFASESPVSFTRFALGLVFEGKAITASGQAIPAKVKGLKSDLEMGSGRDVFDALFQGSLISFAQDKFPAGGEEIKGGRASKGRGTYGGEKASRDGLTFSQVVSLTSTLFGAQSLYFAAEVNNANRGSVVDRLAMVFQDPQQAIGPLAPPRSPFSIFGSRGPTLGVGIQGQLGRMQTVARTPLSSAVRGGFGSLFERLAGINAGKAAAALQIPVGIQADQGGLHQILVSGIKDGLVTYSDPGDAQVKSMPLDEFAIRLQSVILPRDLSPDF